MGNNIGSNPTECLELLIDRHYGIQLSFSESYRSEEIMKEKLLKYVKGVEYCKLEYHKPTETLEGIIEDLYK